MPNAQAAASHPFFVFTAASFSTEEEQQGVFTVLRRDVSAQDYLGAALAQQLPALGTLVGRGHLLVAPASLAAVTKDAACGATTPGMIVYDPEHWDATPQSEQANVAAAIQLARTTVAASGCHTIAVAPDGRFAGVKAGACTWSLLNSVFSTAVLSGVAMVNIQSQGLLSDPCVNKMGEVASLANYVAFVKATVQAIHVKSNSVLVTSQLSFRGIPAERMTRAISALTGIVDGFYIAYPPSGKFACKYCSPINLNLVLSNFLNN